MAEPKSITLVKEGDFDGQTLMTFGRSEFEVEGQQRWSRSFEGAAGVIAGDFFGLFADRSPKVVGVSGGTWNPYSVARVIKSGAPDPVRVEVQLTPQMTHVVMYPGDRLALLTVDEGRPTIQLVVNELSEPEHITQALTSDVDATWRRYRIVLASGQGFVPDPQGAAFQPSFVWNPAQHMMTTVVNGATGPIPSGDLCAYPKFQGCYASVRFANMSANTGQIHLIEGQARNSIVVQDNLKNVEWSKVFFVSHDDYIGLETPPPTGQVVVADIELVRVQPGDRLRGRYERGL
jgi:hypothetical protein